MCLRHLRHGGLVDHGGFAHGGDVPPARGSLSHDGGHASG